MPRRAFTLIELLLVVAIMSVIAAWIVPSYRNYQIHTDLELAAEQTLQMLHRAQLLAQSESTNAWSILVDEGLIFQGTDFMNRDQTVDEFFPLPSSVSVTFGNSVSFSPLFGEPNIEGSIILESILGERKEVPIPQALSGPQSIAFAQDVRIKITYERIKNNGDGSAEDATFVGPLALRYEDAEWIPLKTGTTTHTDTNLVVGALGLAIQRSVGQLTILAYGGLDPGGKEVVDARIVIENARITGVDNNVGEDECEQPFDGNVNDGVGGDEVTLIGEDTVFFQTRVTNAGDSIIIRWEENRPWWAR
jgi:prepilin-type N-terminal cleavage/methylation domain-containing protein